PGRAQGVQLLQVLAVVGEQATASAPRGTRSRAPVRFCLRSTAISLNASSADAAADEGPDDPQPVDRRKLLALFASPGPVRDRDLVDSSPGAEQSPCDLRLDREPVRPQRQRAKE